MSFTFVENPIYDKTNYIYSMYLAREYLKDDILLLHGDLVFDKKLYGVSYSAVDDYVRLFAGLGFRYVQIFFDALG